MNLSDLTREELLLINTDFGEELEKTASSIVEEETEKIAEMEEVAGSCYNYGTELAMQKIAEMEAAYKNKKESEEEEEEEDKDEGEKTASAMGNFILEGYWNTMMEKGAEYYGDENIYLEELCKEAGADKAAKSLISKMIQHGRIGAKKSGRAIKKGWEGTKEYGRKGWEGAKKGGESVAEYHRGIGRGAKAGWTGVNEFGQKLTKGERAKALGIAGAKTLPHFGILGGSTYLATRDKKEKR